MKTICGRAFPSSDAGYLCYRDFYGRRGGLNSKGCGVGVAESQAGSHSLQDAPVERHIVTNSPMGELNSTVL